MYEMLSDVKARADYRRKINSYLRLPPIPQAKIIDDDFWKVGQNDDFDYLSNELWILNLESKSMQFSELLHHIKSIDSFNSYQSIGQFHPNDLSAQFESLHPSNSHKQMGQPNKNPQKPVILKRFGKSNLELEREKHLKVLQDKQPLGRDGKRIPLPVIRSQKPRFR